MREAVPLPCPSVELRGRRRPHGQLCSGEKSRPLRWGACGAWTSAATQPCRPNDQCGRQRRTRKEAAQPPIAGVGGLAQVRAGDTSEALLLPSQSGFCPGRFPLRPSGDASDPSCIAGGSGARRPPRAKPSRRPPGPQLPRLGARERARGGGRKGRGQSPGGARGAEGRGLEEAGPGTSCDSEGQG